MEEKDYHLILVGNTQAGLMGLKTVFEELKDRRSESESVLKELLVDRVGKTNYIPNSVREEYKRGLFREFKKFLGEGVEEEKREVIEVVLLGLGCFSCHQLERDVMAVLSETGTKASFNFITDPNLMTQYGILPMPALIINGKVKSKGAVPTKLMIKKWLEEEKG
jgi:hypothetical protein